MTPTGSGGDTALTLRAVRRLLDGGLPPTICSTSADGQPHVNIVSHVEYVDDEHVALTFQFFNRSRENVLATRRVGLLVEDPDSGGSVAMRLEYLRTETDGPIFERLRAKLAGIAANTGMESVFRLRGADIYRVHDVRHASPGLALTTSAPRCDLAAGARRVAEALGDCADLDTLFRVLMRGLQSELRVDHAILWLLDEAADRLVTVASCGYADSGIGAELPLADAGLSGVALAQGVPLRVGHMARMYRYGQTLVEAARSHAPDTAVGPDITLPGLEMPCSQLALPLRARGRTVGVLLLESGKEQFFAYDDEDALLPLCIQLAQAVQLLERLEMQAGRRAPPQGGADVAGGQGSQVTASAADVAGGQVARAAPGAARSADVAPIGVRYHVRTGTVFLDGHYLIKGVAGAMFWKLAREAGSDGSTEFTTRALRLAATELRLPDVQDNLAVRLLLLQRRLAEWAGPLAIERIGRGRYRFVARRSLALERIED